MEKLILLYQKLIGLFQKQIDMQTPPEQKETSPQKLCRIAKSYLGKDVSYLIDNEVACAEVASKIINNLFSDFPDKILGTDALKKELDKSRRFTQVLQPEIGCVVISPRTATVNGHVGFFILNENIASNDSLTGTFQINYTWKSWIKTFKNGRKLRIFIYKPL